MSDEHLSLDELAELDEGLLAPERTSAARAHLHACTQCAGRVEALRRTSELLADVPAALMPDDVRDRLDRALDAEAGDAAATTDLPAAPEAPSERPRLSPVPAADVMPTTTTVVRSRFGRPSMAASAVAAAVVLVAVAVVVGAHNHGGGTTTSAGGTGAASTAGSAAGVAQPDTFVRTSTGRTYTLANLSKTIPALVLGPSLYGTVSPPPATPFGQGTAAPGASTLSGESDSTTAKHGKTATAPRAAPTGVAGAPAPGTSTSTLAVNRPVAKSLQPLYNSRQRLLHCAAVVTAEPNAVPIAVDFGRWTNGSMHKSPAVVFVFRDPNASFVDAYVVGPRCDGNSIRTFHQVPVS